MTGSADVPIAGPIMGELSGITVLLVDDCKNMRRLGRNFLSAAGYTVKTAVDGFEALSKVVEHCPALVFVDIMTPKLDGYQTCALIKNNAEYRDIPVVLLSGNNGVFDKTRAQMVGCNAHLLKPFTAANLTAVVEEHIGAQSLQHSVDTVLTKVTETSNA